MSYFLVKVLKHHDRFNFYHENLPKLAYRAKTADFRKKYQDTFFVEKFLPVKNHQKNLG